MKLLLHNLLTSPVPGADPAYPLLLRAGEVEVHEIEYDEAQALSALSRIEYGALRQAAVEMGHGDNLPADKPDDAESNEAFLRALHHALVNVEVVQGELECPGSGRVFPINNGIPNLLLREDEV